MQIPLCRPTVGKEEIQAIHEVFDTGLLVHGRKCKDFEKQFAEYVGTKYAISMNSCTSALQLAIESLQLKGEIIVPSFTFTASANAIVLAGCTPVFADVIYKTRNINPLSVRDKITKNTVGIMPVHFGGQSCDMDALQEIAKEYNLRIIEDSAETLGGTFKNKKTGSFGDAGCFSFFPTKNITTGEGGIVTTNHKEVYDYISLRIAHGIKKEGFRRDCVFPGYNMRMTDIQGAIGLVQLKKINKMNAHRRDLAQYYNKKFQTIKEVTIPQEDELCTHVYQMYTITVDKNRRDALVKKLNENDIGASVHFDPPIHKQTYYQKKEFNTKGLTNTEKLSKEIITLPIYPTMTHKESECIIYIINDFFK